MMKPEPSEVTCRGAFGLGPRKFLNRSSSGEPCGNCGMALCDGAFRVWLVEMFTTVGSSLSVRSAKESGAGRAETADPISARMTQTPAAKERSEEGMSGPGTARGESAGSLCSTMGNKQGKNPKKAAAFRF